MTTHAAGLDDSATQSVVEDAASTTVDSQGVRYETVWLRHPEHADEVRGMLVVPADATRLFTSSIRDLLDRWFESPEVQGVMAINGIIGTWAGPDEPGTA